MGLSNFTAAYLKKFKVLSLFLLLLQRLKLKAKEYESAAGEASHAAKQQTAHAEEESASAMRHLRSLHPLIVKQSVT